MCPTSTQRSLPRPTASHMVRRHWGGLALCLGDATTRAAGLAGWQARQVGQDAETLVTALTALQPAGRILHFSGIHTRGDVADRLQAAGLAVDSVAVYDQVLLPLSDAAQNRLKETDPVIVPLFLHAARYISVRGRIARRRCIWVPSAPLPPQTVPMSIMWPCK